ATGGITGVLIKTFTDMQGMSLFQLNR
ncbi:hypothetical protein SEEH4316_11551, partial [Salmonella enterica subsp. enterica serovar Heidelberg str. RI-11-014316]